jgi:peptidoglycan hydrolase CwlO-like protein
MNTQLRVYVIKSEFVKFYSCVHEQNQRLTTQIRAQNDTIVQLENTITTLKGEIAEYEKDYDDAITIMVCEQTSLLEKPKKTCSCIIA